MFVGEGTSMLTFQKGDLIVLDESSTGREIFITIISSEAALLV